jgi:ankyrin repeat protein
VPTDDKENLVNRIIPTLLLVVMLTLCLGLAPAAADPTSDLFDAVRRNDLKTVKHILADNPDECNDRGADQRTPLFTACEAGLGPMTSLLIQAGADVATTDAFGYTPLFVASNKQVIDLLVKAGADLETRDVITYTPLCHAADKGNAVVVAALLEAGADVNGPKTADGYAPLHLASTLAAAQALITHGANVNATSNNLSTPLHLQASHGRADVVAALLKAGAHPQARNAEGSTVLHFAALSNVQCLDVVLPTMPIDTQNTQGQTPLDFAIAKGNVETARFLLDHGASTSIRDAQGRTPIDYARGTPQMEQLFQR